MPVTAAFNSLMGNSFYWVHFLCPCLEREGCEMERPGRRHKCQWVKFIWGDRLHNQQSSWGHRLRRERPWKASQIFWYMYLKMSRHSLTGLGMAQRRRRRPCMLAKDQGHETSWNNLGSQKLWIRNECPTIVSNLHPHAQVGTVLDNGELSMAFSFGVTGASQSTPERPSR